MSHGNSSISADAFFGSQSPIPELMKLRPRYKLINEDRLFVKVSRRKQAFSDEELNILDRCQAYLSHKLELAAASTPPTSCSAILKSMEDQRTLWAKLQERLKTVHDQGIKTETFYGPTPTRVPIQWLAKDGVNGQESPVDDIPVLLLQLYDMFNAEQKLWGLYLGGVEVEEASSETESKSEGGDTEDNLPKELTEFLAGLSHDPEPKQVCVALGTVECSNDGINSYIKTEIGLSEEREDSALRLVDTMTADFYDVRTSVEVARCIMPQRIKEKAHPDGEVSSLPSTASGVSEEGTETKRSKEIAGRMQTLPTCHPM